MIRTALIYGLSISTSAFVLRWLEYQYHVRLFATEIYVVCIAILFTILGIWVGNRLTRGKAPDRFKRNDLALETLGVSEREYDVLEQLANGHSNKEIANKLFISPNTVKSHIKHLYAKLEVSRRTQALQKAKALRLIP